MRLFDKFELLSGFGKFQMAVLVNPSTRDFELIGLDHFPLEPNLEMDFKARGLRFCGTFAVLDGKGCCEFALPLDAESIDVLAGAYAQLVLEKMREQKTNGSTSWLEKLWSLADPREMN